MSADQTTQLDDDLDAPWTTDAIQKQQAALREIDVCGVMQECQDRTCPCVLLGETE